MKKIYLLGLLAAAISANAQSNKNTNPVLNDVAVPATKVTDRTFPSPVQINPNPTSYPSTYFGKVARVVRIGTSQNDQQSNASIYRRVHVFADGKVSATWTTSTDQSPYMQRGSGYNHFDGTAWGPASAIRIESERAGFPNYAFSETTNEEFITSHRVIAQGQPNAGSAGGIFLNKKSLSGSTWTTALTLDTIITYPGVLWNRSVVQGDLLHIIASYTDSSQTQPTRVRINGVGSPQVYSRYRISTNTWELRNVFLPEYDSTRYYAGGGDNYAIDANGANVAILMGGLTDDVALWKSIDSGSTWTKTIIDSFPVPAYDYATTFDTSFSNDGGMNVILDNNGVAHCFWGLARVLDTDAGDGNVSFFPGQINMMYWNETLNVDSLRSIATTINEDATNDFQFGNSWNNAGARYGNHSIITMPSSGMTASGDIYLAYSSLTDNDISGDGRNFRDVYIIRSSDGGATWTTPVNVTKWLGFNVEQIFGSIARTVNGKIHLTFMQKGSIGRYDATNNPGAVGPYDIYYMDIDTAGLFAEPLTGLSTNSNEVFTIGQNYPNPFTGTTYVDLNMKRNATVSVTVMDIVGREIYNVSQPATAGKNQIEINLGAIPSGVYFYTIIADGVKETRKMIVE
jgi:hypothetical protein